MKLPDVTLECGMHVLDETPPPGTTEAKLLLLIFWVAHGLILIAFHFVDGLRPLQIATSYLLLAMLAACLLIAVRLARKGTARIPPGLAVIGIFFIVGGAIFDMVATVLHTPTLEKEGNVVARAFLDSGYSVAFVYGFAIVAQSLLQILASLVWISLLRHREILLTVVENQASFPRFIKAAIGGTRLSWRQFLLPRKLFELPDAYPILWLMVVLSIMSASDRWFLGLAWFGLVSWSSRITWVATFLIAGCVIYFAWLWTASRRKLSATV